MTRQYLFSAVFLGVLAGSLCRLSVWCMRKMGGCFRVFPRFLHWPFLLVASLYRLATIVLLSPIWIPHSIITSTLPRYTSWQAVHLEVSYALSDLTNVVRRELDERQHGPVDRCGTVFCSFQQVGLVMMQQPLFWGTMVVLGVVSRYAPQAGLWIGGYFRCLLLLLMLALSLAKAAVTREQRTAACYVSSLAYFSLCKLMLRRQAATQGGIRRCRPYLAYVISLGIDPAMREYLVRTVAAGLLVMGTVGSVLQGLDLDGSGATSGAEIYQAMGVSADAEENVHLWRGRVDNSSIVMVSMFATATVFWWVQMLLARQIESLHNIDQQVRESRSALDAMAANFESEKRNYRILRQQSEERRREERDQHVENLRRINAVECAHCHERAAVLVNQPCGHCMLCEPCGTTFRERNGNICSVPDCERKSSVEIKAPTLINCLLCYSSWEPNLLFRPAEDDTCDHVVCVLCMTRCIRFSLREKSSIFEAGGIKCPLSAMGCNSMVSVASVYRLKRISSRALPHPRDTSVLPLTESEVSKFERFLIEASIPVERRAYCVNPRCVSNGVRRLNDIGHVSTHAEPFACVFCDTEICRRCKRRWHPEQKDCDLAHQEKSSETLKLIELTTKMCPKAGCTTRVSHWHGHACHHISPSTNGCPTCHTHWCYSCQSIGRRCQSSPACRLYCTNENVQQYLDASSGWPVDTRCGCPVCPDCRPNQPCVKCPGSCVVCRGIVPHGELDRTAAGLGGDDDAEWDPSQWAGAQGETKGESKRSSVRSTSSSASGSSKGWFFSRIFRRRGAS